ncbi:hypothetical protein AXX16_3081 [Serratia rubidaea]|nr:hypothetical protein [Serratia rubidaea]AML58778.1 hypothetical protein AXX16_3081 [Serratia rubidaea]
MEEQISIIRRESGEYFNLGPFFAATLSGVAQNQLGIAANCGKII